jgi:dihydroorotate dehydrogenase (NAD+) catalytic subunit
MLNRIGLQNPGIDQFIAEELPFWQEYRRAGGRVIVNISGESEDEFSILAEKLRPEIAKFDFLELNVSCPNVANGLAFGTTTEAVVSVVKAVTEVFPNTRVTTKLTPNVTDISEVAVAVIQAGSCAISAINTVQAADVDIETGQMVLGGYSGSAIRPIATRCISQIHQAAKQAKLQPSIIGMGGVTTAKDVIKHMMAGANLVAVGTAGIVNPTAVPQILDDLKRYCRHKSLAIQTIVGKAIL